MNNADIIEKSSRLETIGFYILIWTGALLPIFLIPSISVPFQTTKTALILLSILIAFFLFTIARLKEGKITLPKISAIIAISALPFAYLLSSLFSGNISMSIIGQGFALDTFSFIAAMILMLFLISMFAKSKKQISTLYLGLFISFAVLVIFQGLRLLFGSDFLTLGIFTSSTANLIGKWNDLAIFFGLMSILSLTTLERPHFGIGLKTLVYIILIISVLFLAIINFFLVWVVVGIFALGFFVYNLSRKNLNWGKGTVITQESGNNASAHRTNKKALFASILVIVISFAFIISGGSIGNWISDKLNIAQIEARPAWQSTIDVTRETYKENLLFGSGPNTFANQWALLKPRAINNTLFWNVDFGSGVGFIPTSFVTSGLLGGLSWIAFFILLLYSGFRGLISGESKDRLSHYLTLSLFLGSLYLWIMSVIYVPNVVNIALAFLFTGLFFASLEFGSHKFLKKKIVFADNPRLGFISVLVLTIFLIISSVSLYTFSREYVSALQFQSGFVALNMRGDIPAARKSVNEAIRYGENDLYYRFLTDLNLNRLNNIVADTSTPIDERRSQFQTALADSVLSAQRATELDEESYINWTTLGRVYGSIVGLGVEGAYESAQRSYNRALELNPESPAIYLQLARLETTRGNFDEARENIGKALERKNDYTEAIFLLSQIDIQTGNIEAAINSVEATTVINPSNPVFFFQLGLLNYSVGEDGKAIEALERAVALNTDYANARYFLGLSYYREGRTEDAIEQFEIVSNLNPDNGEVKLIIENLKAGREPFADVPAQESPENLQNLPIEGE